MVFFRTLPLLILATGTAISAAAVDTYIQQVNSLAATHRGSINRLAGPATVTSQALVSGGAFYLGNNDAAFFYEGAGRSGGLMAVQQYLGPQSMHAGDVLWVSYNAGNYQNALNIAVGVQQVGAAAVVFGPRPPSGAPPFTNWVDSLTPWAADDDFTLMGNVLSLWSMTAELAAATARQGKTLVFWQSISVPGGTARNADYANLLFHTGVPRMAPVQAGIPSGAYLDYVAAMLGRIATSELSNITSTGETMGQRAAAGNPVTLLTASHLIPFVTSLSSPYFHFLGDPSALASTLAHSGYLVDIGYAGVELDLWRTVRMSPNTNAAWVVTRLPTQADFTFYGDTVIDQRWDFGDCTVQMPGYDVCISPASGVAQLFIYELLLKAASGTPAGGSATLVPLAGTGQSAVVNSPFTQTLQTKLSDGNGNAIANATVLFAAPASGPSGTFSGALNTSAITNVSGIATVSIAANSLAGGPYTVSATTSGVASAAIFSLTNLPGPPATLLAVLGTPQTEQVNAVFPATLQAILKDSGSNPIPNAAVTFTTPTSSASCTFPGAVHTAQTVTGASGVAISPACTASAAAGSYTVTASINALSAPFSLTNTAAPVITGPALAAISGNLQSALAFHNYPAPITVKLTNASGNPVAQAPVTFRLPAFGPSGYFTGGVGVAIVNTDGNGLASVGFVTANPVLGSYQLTADANGLQATFNLSNTAVASGVGTLTAIAGITQSAAVNSAFAQLPQAKLTDSNGVAMPNTAVLFTAPASGATGAFAGGGASISVNTDSQGIATAPVFTANGTAGAYVVRATSNGLTASFNLTNTAIAVPPGSGTAQLVIVSGNSQTAGAYQNFPLPLTVKLTDGNGNPIAQAPVTFRAPTFGAGGYLTGGVGLLVVNTDPNGLASAGYFTANPVMGSYVITADANGQEAVFNLTNQ